MYTMQVYASINYRVLSLLLIYRLLTRALGVTIGGIQYYALVHYVSLVAIILPVHCVGLVMDI